MTDFPRPPCDTPAIRVVMMPRDVNAQGAIFGGVLLSLIDQAAFVEALRQAAHKYVTVAFESVEFHKPVLVGDVLSLWAETVRVGRTSLRIRVSVDAQREGHDEPVRVTRGHVVMVAVGDDGEPIPVSG